MLALVAGLLVYWATRSEGEVVRKADLHDGGVWVTSSSEARYGRLNIAASQFDLGVGSDGAAGTVLDIFQDGAAVLGYSAASTKLAPIDPVAGTRDDDAGVVLPKPSTATGNQVFVAPPVDLRGGTVALVEPQTGKVRAARVDQHAGIDSLEALQTQAKPLATVGANAAVAVAEDGSVFAVSAATGTLAVIRPDAAGGLAPASTVRLGFTGKTAQVSSIGSRWVVLDDATGNLYVEGAPAPTQISVGDQGAGLPFLAALQQPGPASAAVVVQDNEAVEQVVVDDDAPPQARPGIKRVQGGEARMLLSAPVRVGSCVHAAWTGGKDIYYGRSCDGAAGVAAPGAGVAPTQTVALTGLTRGTRTQAAKLRTNRDQVVLNDLDSGDAWDIETDKRLKIDNWQSLVPPPQTDDKNKQKDQNLVDDDVNRTPPKAVDDLMLVRPGRTTTLHVLDNDTDASGSILAIAPGDVGTTGVDGITATASADGQSVQVTLPEEPRVQQFQFSYTVNNGTAKPTKDSTARVTVRLVGDDVNTPPHLRAGQAKLAQSEYPALKGATTKVGVIADWRDAENDPLAVEGTDDSVNVDGANTVLIGPREREGAQVVGYRVRDGRGASTDGTIRIKVLGDDDKPVPPRTQPDVVRTVVGKPVQVLPLGNDIPGADPTDPGAQLKLAADVQGPGQLSLDTNTDSGVVTITGATAGTSIVTYAAQSGGGAAAGRIRVDVVPDPGSEQPPVATPDSATLLGQLPVVADVLSNDVSPRGDVLVVQRVTPTSSWIRASIVQGRWVRLQAKEPVVAKERTGTVSYVVSDGTRTAVGQIAVTQKPTSKDPLLPTVVDDTAVVRSGDAVSIPVLDNDSMAGGTPLAITPASVRVVLGEGQAFASGSVVRFVPEATGVTAPTTAVIEYSAYPEGAAANARTGRVTVTVNPLPGATNPNRAPTARSFSASVTAGDALTITVPTSGVDPDGDLAFVGGIAGENGGAIDLTLGRVLGFGAASIRYEAYPRSSGTEVIRYVLRDRFGGTSEGFVRVGVVQPGDPQPPIAVEDSIVAAPGRTVTVDVLGNDLVSAGDRVELVPLDTLNEPDELKAFTHNKDNTFSTVVPQDGGAKVLTYGITNGLFDPSQSTLLVRGQTDFNNPPVAVDDVGQAKPGETSILVDAVANDRDVDGKPGELKVTRLVGDGAVLEGGKVRITLQKTARVLPYVIEDADGASSMALIYVPAGDNGLPFTVVGKTIRMDPNSTVKVDLNDYVSDPAGGQVRATSPETLSSTPKKDLQSGLESSTTLTLTSLNGYVGPAAVMLEVEGSVPLSGTSADAAQPGAAGSAPGAGAGSAASGATTSARTYVTIPVQVGPDVPVLRCPAYEITLAADGPARSFDIPRLCRAWLPSGLAAADARYEASWAPAPGDVSLNTDGSGRVTVQAGAGAKAGATGTIEIRAKGATESFTVGVRVTSQPPLPTLRPVVIEGMLAGSSRTVNLRQYLDSPLSTVDCALTAATVTSGQGVSVSRNGCQLTVTASDQARFAATVAVAVRDNANRSPVSGEVRISLRGKPDPMGTPSAVADRIQGGSARVTFSPPTYDGGLPIQAYELRINGGETRPCTASPCTVTGLTNGVDYRFEVRARNAVGWSDWSGASAVVRPDTKPQAASVTALKPGDRTMNVTWAAPKNEGSAIIEYQLQWTNVGAGAGQGGTKKVPAGSLATLVSGLVNNDEYTYRVQARNGAGWGPYGPTLKGQSFGTPGTVPAPTLAPRAPTPDADNAQVSISWPAVDPNGPAITGYQVFRRTEGGGWAQIATVAGGAQRVASDSIPYQGQTVQYAVTATNGGNKTSARSNFSSYVANGVPVQPVIKSVTTPRADYSANISYGLGNPHAKETRRVEWRTSTGRSGSWDGGGSGNTITGLPVGDTAFSIRACNDAGRCSPWSNPVNAVPYGPTRGVGSVSGSHTDNSITFSWNRPAANGNPIQGYKLTGDVNTTVGAGQTSYTFTGLGYSTTRTITVTPFADRSGDGPSSSGRETTNAAPPPPPPTVVGLYPTGNRGLGGDCTSGNCPYIGYELRDFQGQISCTFDTDTGQFPYPRDDGGGGSHEPTNGANRSTKYYGFASGWVKITCTGANGSDSMTRNPWGGGQ